ncbi:hypothetical protein [Sinomonas humi]|nr:hypothetical protein [Sinomonas humi]
MGFLTRLFIPRKVRRLVHPVRGVKRSVKKAVVPKPVRNAMWTAHKVAHPVDSAAYALERSLRTKARTAKSPVYMHTGCSVRHRSPEARTKCRNGR